ncbi:hypothetical protein [Streptomyces sp. NPDC005435]
MIPKASLGFTRQTSRETGRGADGLPACVTSVLVAGEGCGDYPQRQGR